ncbi:MAG: hypothetical protein LBF92_06290 [Synergistaceae bacterium]|nr:hypothetical protein [Synergistaceae bacterium]
MQKDVASIHDRLDNIEAKQDATDARLDAMGARQDATDAKLDAMSARQDATDARLDAMDAKLDAMSAWQGRTDARLDTLDARTEKLALIIENQIDRAIKILSEGHMILNRKLDECIGLSDRVESLEHRMSAAEYALKK